MVNKKGKRLDIIISLYNINIGGPFTTPQSWMMDNIIFLLTISIDCQEQSLGELINWLQRDQSLIFSQILSTNFFLRKCREINLENLCVDIGAKTKLDHTMWGGVECFWCVINNSDGWSVLVCWICLRRGWISNTNANKLILL